MSNLTTLPKGDSAWLFRKAIERIIQQISDLETNIGSSTTGNSANTQIIFNDNGVLRGDPDLTFNTALNKLVATALESTTSLVVGTSATITGDLTVKTNVLKVDTTNNRVGIGTAIPAVGFDVGYTESVFGSSTSSGYSILNLIGTGTGSARYGSIRKNYDSPFDLRIRASNSNTDAPIIFELSNASTAMTLNSTGLGVGGSPGYKLDVQGTSAGVLRLVNILNLSTDPAAVTRLSLDGQGATWHLDNERTNGIFKITRNSTACLTIDNSGNVGIGVTSPDFKLVVNGTQAVPDTTGSSTTNGSLRIGAPGTGLCIDSGVTAATDIYGWIQARSRTNYATNFNLVLQPNGGNVGIGFVPGAGAFSKVLFIGTGTEPTAGATGAVQYFTSTRSANNTIPAILCEGSGVTNAGITSTTVTNKIAIKVNGTIYYLLATTSAA